MNEQQPKSFLVPVVLVDYWMNVLSAPLLRLSLWYFRHGYTGSNFLPRQERERIAEGLGIGVETARALRQRAARLRLLEEVQDVSGEVIGDRLAVCWSWHTLREAADCKAG